APPFVAVAKTSPGPPFDAPLNPFHRFDKRLADPADVGNLRVFAYPDAVVDHAAQMFGEVAVYLRRDCADRLVQKKLDSPVGPPRLFRGEATPGHGPNPARPPRLDEITSFY